MVPSPFFDLQLPQQEKSRISLWIINAGPLLPP